MASDAKVLAVMQEMVVEGKDLTRDGKPEIAMLSHRVGAKVSVAVRDRLMGKIELVIVHDEDDPMVGFAEEFNKKQEAFASLLRWVPKAKVGKCWCGKGVIHGGHHHRHCVEITKAMEVLKG